MFRLLQYRDRAKKDFKPTSNLQRAIENCQLELAKDPTNAELHVKLGDLYIEWHLDIHQARQYIDEAITEYQRALESYIDSDAIYFKIGMAFYYKNEIDRAINYFNLAVEKNKKNDKAYYLLACCHTRKAHFPDAMEYAQKAINLKPFSSSRAHYLRYNLYRVMSVKNFKVKLQRQKEFLLALLTLPFDKYREDSLCFWETAYKQICGIGQEVKVNRAFYTKPIIRVCIETIVLYAHKQKNITTSDIDAAIKVAQNDFCRKKINPNLIVLWKCSDKLVEEAQDEWRKERKMYGIIFICHIMEPIFPR